METEDSILHDAGGEFCNLDEFSEKDRGLIRRFITRHPNEFGAISPAKRRRLFDRMERVSEISMEIAEAGADVPTKLAGCAQATSATKTQTMMVAIDSRESIHYHECLRVDAGLATARVEHSHKHAHAHVDFANPEVADALWALHRATSEPEPKRVENGNGNGAH